MKYIKTYEDSQIEKESIKELTDLIKELIETYTKYSIIYYRDTNYYVEGTITYQDFILPIPPFILIEDIRKEKNISIKFLSNFRRLKDKNLETINQYLIEIFGAPVTFKKLENIPKIIDKFKSNLDTLRMKIDVNKYNL
jgi:hypothetical protein